MAHGGRAGRVGHGFVWVTTKPDERSTSQFSRQVMPGSWSNTEDLLTVCSGATILDHPTDGRTKDEQSVQITVSSEDVSVAGGCGKAVWP